MLSIEISWVLLPTLATIPSFIPNPCLIHTCQWKSSSKLMFHVGLLCQCYRLCSFQKEATAAEIHWTIWQPQHSYRYTEDNKHGTEGHFQVCSSSMSICRVLKQVAGPVLNCTQMILVFLHTHPANALLWCRNETAEIQVERNAVGSKYDFKTNILRSVYHYCPWLLKWIFFFKDSTSQHFCCLFAPYTSLSLDFEQYRRLVPFHLSL